MIGRGFLSTCLWWVSFEVTRALELVWTDSAELVCRTSKESEGSEPFSAEVLRV
jgi:hypothetical protein